MFIETHLITLAASAQQFPAPSTFGEGPRVCRVFAEPLRSITHASFVGTSAVTNDGSGTGVIKELAVPGAANVTLDMFDHRDENSDNNIDPTQLWAHGTTGDKLKVTYYIR